MKSVAERAYTAINKRPVGSMFAVSSIASAVGTEGNGVASLCSKMHREGFLDKVGRGHYRVTDRTHRFGEMVSFRAKRKGTPELSATAAAPDIWHGLKPGSDVLQNLLDAMAAAEPEIRRLMELDKHVKSLAERYTMS